MILVDTSVWIDHLRSSDPKLESLLARNQVMCHPFVIGEMALGTIRKREAFLGDLRDLPGLIVAQDDEVLYLIASRRMHGLGIGYVDAHLLASIKVSPGVLLWTRDKRLQQVAASLKISFPDPRVN